MVWGRKQKKLSPSGRLQRDLKKGWKARKQGEISQRHNRADGVRVGSPKGPEQGKWSKAKVQDSVTGLYVVSSSLSSNRQQEAETKLHLPAGGSSSFSCTCLASAKRKCGSAKLEVPPKTDSTPTFRMKVLSGVRSLSSVKAQPRVIPGSSAPPDLCSVFSVFPAAWGRRVGATARAEKLPDVASPSPPKPAGGRHQRAPISVSGQQRTVPDVLCNAPT